MRVMRMEMEATATGTDSAGGDRRDVEAFCRSAHPRLVRTLTAATGDAGLADEITQEALTRAWERWDTVSLLEQPEAWCYRVALNLARSQFRRRAALRRAHDRLAPPPTTAESSASDAELMAALRRLPDTQRSVLALRFLADLSVEATAEVLRMPIGTVKSTTSRGLAELREILGSEHDDA